MEFLAHPITVATYAVFLSLLVASVRGLFRLYLRLGHVEKAVQGVESKVDGLACDLRQHMTDEGASVAELKTLIEKLYD